MNDINPTLADLHKWAKNPDGQWLDQDWDLIVAGSVDPQCILELANSDYPGADFFVHCLYILVGSCVDAPSSTLRETIEELLSQAEKSKNSDVLRWVERSRVFLANPNAYPRSCWTEGGWAMDETIWRDEDHTIDGCKE